MAAIIIAGKRPMDTARYYIALAMITVTPGALLYWFSIHPFVRFWRNVGPWWTIGIHYTSIAALAALLFRIRQPLLSIEFGTNAALIALSIPLYVCAIVLRRKLSRKLKFRILTGLPELAPEKYATGLIVDGIYARIRHPRYVEILVALLAYALFCNYLATYVLFFLAWVILLLVVRFEEKELRDRFGAEYDAYAEWVPRFVPKF